MVHRSAFGDYLRDVGAREIPALVLPEETAPDLSSASSARHAELVATVKPADVASQIGRSGLGFTHFIDGVQRTIMLRIVDVQLPGGVTVQVPIHGVHIVAGALVRRGSTLQPYLLRSAKVLLLPFYTLREADSTRFGDPPGTDLDPEISGFVYPQLISSSAVFSDTAIPLQRGRGARLSVEDLVRSGELRTRALQRAKVLLRILELGLLEEVLSTTETNVLVDGPLGPMFKYYGSIVSEGLDRVSSIDRWDTLEDSYRFLSRIVGVVKNVIIIPTEGVTEALAPNEPSMPVFRFSDVLRGNESSSVDDEVYKAILSAFVRLRPEMPGLWSPIAGLTRLDIPLPFVADSDYRSPQRWVEEMVNEPALTLTTSEESLLSATISDYLELRWPLPGAFGRRSYTELYAVAETERWLQGQLLHPYELRRQLTA